MENRYGYKKDSLVGFAIKGWENIKHIIPKDYLSKMRQKKTLIRIAWLKKDQNSGILPFSIISFFHIQNR